MSMFNPLMSINKPFHSSGCECALGRVNRYPESWH